MLDGVFSDEAGDWPAGSYLLNPEGFRHAPFSRAGCVIFVRLRRFPGVGRDHVTRNSDGLPWVATERAGVASKLVREQRGFAGSARMERWAPGLGEAPVTYPDGVEFLVLQGGFDDALGHYGRGTWLRLPPGYAHRPRTAAGCTLYACVIERPR